MGGAIARGLAKENKYTISVSNPSEAKLQSIKESFPYTEVTTDNVLAADGADIIILAIKPWKVQGVIEKLKNNIDPARQQVVSVAAGISTESLSEWFNSNVPVYYVIPNTAISIRESMTFMSHRNASPSQVETVKAVFDALGTTLIIEEKQMKACMALASCGIAYAMRYVRANVEGAVELGIAPSVATTIVANTMKGAADLLLTSGSHPEIEIDKVTTPGGLTIKGLNALEARGFSNAVVEALKASV